VPPSTWLSNAASMVQTPSDVAVLQKALRLTKSRCPAAPPRQRRSRPKHQQSPVSLNQPSSSARSSPSPPTNPSSQPFFLQYSQADAQKLIFFVAFGTFASILVASAGIIVATVIVLVAALLLIALLAPKSPVAIKLASSVPTKVSPVVVPAGVSLLVAGSGALTTNVATHLSSVEGSVVPPLRQPTRSALTATDLNDTFPQVSSLDPSRDICFDDSSRSDHTEQMCVPDRASAVPPKRQQGRTTYHDIEGEPREPVIIRGPLTCVPGTGSARETVGLQAARSFTDYCGKPIARAGVDGEYISWVMPPRRVNEVNMPAIECTCKLRTK